uniref:Uncharacterized protein n=1 Tax=Anguilla anguilla TaxID=7936 RepID=A0A0E9Q376_ANGAN
MVGGSVLIQLRLKVDLAFSSLAVLPGLPEAFCDWWRAMNTGNLQLAF